MTDYQMLEKIFVEDHKGLPQYLGMLDFGPVYIVRATRKYAPKGLMWYDRGDLMLAFGEPQTRTVWNPRSKKFDIGRLYIQIYSAAAKSLCLAPRDHLNWIETVKEKVR